MRITPHLCFDGQCRSAFDTYQKIFGGSIITMLTYGGSPMVAETDPRWHGHIVHATLDIGGLELTGVDLLPPDFKRPQGFFVTVTLDEQKQAHRVFAGLADGGEIRLAFQPTFWSPGFGIVVDRFSIPWEINSAAAPKTA